MRLAPTHSSVVQVFESSGIRHQVSIKIKLLFVQWNFSPSLLTPLFGLLTTLVFER
jgi:hypothetical protein